MQNNLVAPSASVDHIGKTGPYLAMLFSGLGLAVIGGVVAANDDSGMGLIVLGVAVVLAASINFMVLLYQVWRFVINESSRRNLIPSIETPGKAVGYCFIPFFNLYWMFQAFGKFPKDLNAVASAKGSHETMSEGLGLAIPILTLTGFIPVVGSILAVVNVLIVYPMFITQAVRLCNELGSMSQESTQPPSVAFAN